MATSGSTDFTMTRDNIIEQSLWLIGALGEGETPSTDTLTKCAFQLNMMIKSWQADGLNLWTTQEATLFLTESTASFNLNSSTGDNASDSVVETELSSAAAASATTLTVDSTTGMTASDVVCISLDDGTLDSTTIVSVDSSTQITITTGLTSAAAVNQNVYTFTTRAGRPLDILDVRLRNGSDIDRQLIQLGREEYFSLPQKEIDGTPTSWYYDPQLTTGKLYLWPRPEDAESRIKYTYSRTIEDFDSASDNPDMPVEWFDALVFNLAMRIAPAYGKGAKLAEIAPLAIESKEMLKGWDNGKASINISLDDRF